MATIVCQGLHTCLESQLNEPRTLMLKLASPKPSLSQPREQLTLKSPFMDSNMDQAEEKLKINISLENKQLNTKPDKAGWSFLQDLNKISKDEKVYVHPSMKNSSSKLSEKSLDMCTENLGNETGTDIIESSIFSSSLNSKKHADIPARKEFKSNSGTKKVVTPPRELPPPLTTLSGSQSLEVRSERENGRLVIKAIKNSSSRTCFHAERSDGRLRLSMDYCLFDYESENDDESENEDEYDEEYCLREAVECNKDMDVEAQVGMENFQRLSRCNERQCGNKRFLNWEPFCVATS